MTTSTPSVNLWVRSEPFIYGVFQVHPHPRLALNNIKKLVTYAKNKGKSGFPRLSYPIWKYIACKKLSISEELAWNLFQTCMIMNSTNMQKLKELELKLQSCNTEEEREQVKNVQSTELFRFVLFLYIQQINKISLRASMVSPNAEWPGITSKSGDFESGRSTPTRPCKSIDENNHFQFVSENLMEILDLLVEPDSYGLGGSESNLSTEAVDALSFLIEGTCDRSKTIRPFNEIAHIPALSNKTGFSKISRTFSVRGLNSWIRSCLISHPFSVDNCLSSGKRLQWPIPTDTLNPNESSNSNSGGSVRRQRIVSNSGSVPKESSKGNKLVVLSLVSNQAVAQSSVSLQDACVKIHRCHHSYIYLLSPMRAVSVEKCRKLTLVVGPVENTLYVNQCEECVIIAPCRRVVISGSRRTTFYLLVSTRPVLISTGPATSLSVSGGLTGANSPSPSGNFGPNEEIIFAPYHTFYPKLGEHLTRSGLDPSVNNWDQPLIIGGDQKHDPGPCWELINPQDFYPFTIPFEMEGPTNECPVSWPSRYQNAINERKKVFQQWRQIMRESELNSEKRNLLRTLVEQRFKNWLSESGNQRQLSLLEPSFVGGISVNNHHSAHQFNSLK